MAHINALMPAPEVGPNWWRREAGHAQSYLACWFLDGTHARAGHGVYTFVSPKGDYWVSRRVRWPVDEETGLIAGPFPNLEAALAAHKLILSTT